MKKPAGVFAIILSALLFLSCDKINSVLDDNKTDPNTIGGDTNIPVAQAGNEIKTSTVKVGNNNYTVEQSIKVTKNENGIATIKVIADLSKISSLNNINNMIPVGLKDAAGKINTEVRYKITSEGIQDYFNKDGKQHTITKFNANVGDKYQLVKSDGRIITRTVTAVSTTDDFPYQSMNIKTIKVEQDSRIPGISKIIYQVNHKYGLVYLEVRADDGSTASTYFYPTNN